MLDPVPNRAPAALLSGAALGLIVLVLSSPSTFIYDEPYFVTYVHLFYTHGLTIDFLNSLTGTVGPLYAFVHLLFQPFTALEPTRMRMVNVFLLTLTAATLAACAKRQSDRHYLLTGALVLVVPMSWVVAGMALSEMPAILFVTFSVYCQLRAITAMEHDKPLVPWFIASGLCLGIAVWGRQPFILLSGVPLLLATLDRRLRLPTGIFVIIVLSSALPLFFIWKGLVPPSHHGVQKGLSVTHAILSMGYTGLCMLFLGAKLRWPTLSLVTGLVAATSVFNLLFGGVMIYPLRSVLEKYLSHTQLHGYGLLCASAFLSSGAITAWILVDMAWNSRRHFQSFIAYTGLLCVALSPLFVAHQYSSRYTAMAIPYLILASRIDREWRATLTIPFFCGCIIGALSLYGYFS